MDPKRLQEIAAPLDKEIERRGFELQEDPGVAGSIRAASFRRGDDVELDYLLEVEKDEDRGDYDSSSKINLDLTLYRDGEPIEICDDICDSSNMPAPNSVEHLVKLWVRPGLDEHL